MRTFFNRYDVRVSAVYCLVATLWFVASDTLVADRLTGSTELLKSTSILIGLGFVIVTTAALFVMVTTELAKRKQVELSLQPMLDDLGLIPTFAWYLKRYKQQTGITVDFKHREVELRFSPVIETTLYRIVREALTNVARYAQVTRASAVNSDHNSAI